MTDPAKILVLCADAADSQLISQWSQAGHLPTLRRLLCDGFVRRVENPTGLYTGAVWPSFYTGVSPARHGRYFFRQLQPGTYKVDSFTAKEVKRAPFWDALGRAGRRVVIIDVPKAPPTTTPNVTQVADWGTHDPEPYGMRCWPESLGDNVLKRFGTEPVGPCDKYCETQDFELLRDRLVQRVAKKEVMLASFLAQGGWDIFIGGFTESHCSGHQLWHLHDPQHPKHDPHLAASLGNPLLDVYKAIDAALGRLIEMAGRNVPVVVYASHGMGAHYDGTYLLDEVLRRLEVAAPRIREWERLRKASVWLRYTVPWGWILPSRLRKLGRGLAENVEESTFVADRRERIFFQVPTNDNCAGIRINLRGREPEGKVAPGAELEALCEALTADLMDLVNLGTGQPAVRAVHRTDDLFAGEYRDDLPDILVQWHRDAPFSGLGSPKVGKIYGSYSGPRTGDHRPDGLLIVHAPGGRGDHSSHAVSVMDIAPTLAAALGVALEDVDGRVIPELAGLLVAEAAVR